jgi:hypothetical protein
MQQRIVGLVAAFMAMPLLSCSMNLGLDSEKPKADPASVAQDDAACQSSGTVLGSPAYQQCMQNFAQQRANAERADFHPYYVPQR